MTSTPIQVYGVYSAGWAWYMKGFVDAGVHLQVGLEHTSGAGPCSSPKEEFDHCFQSGFPWSANTTMGVVKKDLEFFDFLGPRQVAAGVFSPGRHCHFDRK